MGSANGSIMEIFSVLFTILIFIAGCWFAWESSVMVSEKKARQRAGTHDYYDNPIIDEKKNEKI
jgi:hypothetical protein